LELSQITSDLSRASQRRTAGDEGKTVGKTDSFGRAKVGLVHVFGGAKHESF